MSDEVQKQEITTVETVPTERNESESPKKQNIFKRFWGSIYHKPEKRQNAWKLLTNLTRQQQLTFAAGNTRYYIFLIYLSFLID
jgi:hypothetical protein